jgi:hypothetical protein
MSRSFALLLLIAGLLTSCGHSSSIVGKWQTPGDQSTMVWEFAENGGVTQGTIRGKYTFGDNKRLKIETPFATSVYQMELEGDRLTLTDSRGTALNFTRVQARR